MITRLPIPRLTKLALGGLLLLSLGGCLDNSVTNPPVVHDLPLPTGEEDTTVVVVDEGEQDTLTEGLMSIAAGQYHSCALKNLGGTLWCWGENQNGEIGNEDQTNNSSFAQVSEARWLSLNAGTDHNCAIDSTQQLWCWGSNTSGQLGASPPVNQQSPLLLVAEGETWLHSAAGQDHSCAIRSDFSLWCWGNNQQNQLGIIGVTEADRPLQVDSLTDWQYVSAANQFSCGLRAITEGNQSLFCWGKNDAGQAGVDPATTTRIDTPTQIGTADQWQSLDTGGQHACAIDASSKLFCWGDNLYGQLGLGNNGNQFTPSQVGSSSWQAVSTGGQHSCAIQDDGSLWCWGNNNAGQLGLGTTQTQAAPVKIEHDRKWLLVTAGEQHTCALDEDYNGYCWGLNLQGQLGNGAALPTNLAIPRQYEGSDNWYRIDAGRQHSCGLKQDFSDINLKTLWCGGLNSYGQLGIHSTGPQDAPQQVSGPDQKLQNWLSFSLGQYSTCAITIDQQLYCWGNNSHGQLASANTGNSQINWGPNTPISLGSDNWLKISAGAVHSCGIKNYDELWCWGDNSTGQIGTGVANATPVTTPFQVSGSWMDVAVGGYIDPVNHPQGGHTCAIKSDQTLWCWGENSDSQLGDGGTILQSQPQQVNADTDWQTVTAGNSHSCALKTDQSIWCWGRYDQGATGTANTPATQPLAISISDHLWEKLATGENSNCAIDINHELWCWGAGADGQITYASTINREDNGNAFVPGKASFSYDWQEVTIGQTHGCGIREDNVGNRTLYCWGLLPQIQLGDGKSWEESPEKLSLQ